MADEIAINSHAQKKSAEVVRVLVKALKAGNSRRTSCKLARIHKASFYRWLADDEEFATLIRLAEAEAEQEAIAKIQLAGEQDWRALAWVWERRNRADWGKKDDVNVNLRDLRNLTDEQVLALEARVTEGEAEEGPGSDEDDV